MVCDLPKRPISWLSIISFILIFGIIFDNILHYHEYVDMAECKQTFHESCKLIAVPESVNGLLDGTK
jgi:hypothetical protein